MLSHAAVLLLDRLEREERRLLSWGFVEGAFDADELYAHAEAVALEHSGTDGDSLIRELLEATWLFQVPHDEGHYRTRSAEVVRLLARLKQQRVFPATTPQQAEVLWRTSPPLVADYRLLVAARRFPRREFAAAVVEAQLEADRELAPVQRLVARAMLLAGTPDERRLSGFQLRATQRVLRGAPSTGTVVCAGTGTGKTLSFYLPAFLRLAPLLDVQPWTKALAIYPRNELLKDQLKEALETAARVAPALKKAGRRSLVLGAFYGDVPRNWRAVATPRGWKMVRAKGQPGRECPFVRCPSCAKQMVWLEADGSGGRERLVCPTAACASEYGPELLRLTREAMLASPPDVLFTSTEMLSQRLASTEFGPLLGTTVPENRRPVLMLLDEVHTYEGSHGAHVAMLLRRWRHVSRADAHVVGLSATLEDAARFFADLVGLAPSSVAEVSPSDGEMDSEGADYQIALRGDPMSGTSLLSTTIQTAMLMSRAIGPGPEPNLLAGNKVFAFADNLDVLNRLFDNLRDAEGRWPNNQFRARGTVLAGLRSRARRDAVARYREGQSWDLVQSIGHTLDVPPSPASSKEVHRTMSLDPGVESRADVVVATASLEVGYDDPRVGVVIQHKAPQSDASFLQRKGRAGRMRRFRPDGTSVSMRPWTIVVLSDFGRDRVAYQDYEHIFSPQLAPRYLPTSNRALLRMQATYALFDWLGSQLRAQGLAPDPWSDLASWENADAVRRARYVRLLSDLLDHAQTQRDFGNYLRSALLISADEVEAVLWEPPRSVFLEAVPTLLRRLERDWQREFEPTREPAHRFGPPLPEFVQKTLFGELLLPEVGVCLPSPDEMADATSYAMPLFQCLREFAPGRVSRRFGLEGGVSHWVAPGEGAVLGLDAFCPDEAREVLGRFSYKERDACREVLVYRPFALVVTEPPPTIADTSNARTEWRSQLLPSTSGHSLDVPSGVPLAQLIDGLNIHTHHLGGPVEIRRFAIGARVSLMRAGGARDPERLVRFVTASGDEAALGTVLDVDGLELRFHYPHALVERVAGVPELVRSLRPLRLRDMLRADSRIPVELNGFHRDMLGEAVLGALVSVCAERERPLNSVAEGLSTTAIASTLRRMATWFSGDGSGEEASAPSSSDGGNNDADEGGAPSLPRRVRELEEALNDGLLAVLRELATVLWSPIDAAWEPWLKRSFAATLGASLHGAILSLCPTVDERALLVDLDADLTGEADPGLGRLWVSETSIGGAGALEAFYGAYCRDPRSFYRLWAAELEAGDFERVAGSLEELIVGAAEGRSVLGQHFERVRNASNHRDALDATTQLRTVLARSGFTVDTSLMAAVHARLLRPGSSTDFDRYLADTLKDWAALEERLGVSVDIRQFALCRATDPRLELAIRVNPPSANRDEAAAWRCSTLQGLLWRRPDHVRRESLRVQNLFSESPVCDRLLVAVCCPERAKMVDIGEPDWFAKLEGFLTETGEVLLSAPLSDLAGLARALLEVATRPIDAGGVRVYGRAGAVRRGATSLVATIEMPEALQ
jgi:hypothetical protein